MQVTFIQLLFIVVLRSATDVSTQGLPPSTGTDPSQIDVDVNSRRHIILRTPAPRDWHDVTVEINERWRFKFTGVPKMSSVCINAEAFALIGGAVSNNPALTGTPVYFSPKEMNVKEVSVRAADGKVMPLHSMSVGMIKPLTSQQASSCLSAVKNKVAK